MDGQAPRPAGKSTERARMARRRALHRRRPVDGGCATRFRGPLFRRPTGDRGLCNSRNRSYLIQEGSRRPDRSFRGGRPEESRRKVKSTNVKLSNTEHTILDQNSPNPFVHSTTIGYKLPAKVRKAKIMFYDSHRTLIRAVEIDSRGGT